MNYYPFFNLIKKDNYVSLTTSQKNQFECEGYVVVENALKTCDLAPLIQRYTDFIDMRASKLLHLGKICSSGALLK